MVSFCVGSILGCALHTFHYKKEEESSLRSLIRALIPFIRASPSFLKDLDSCVIIPTSLLQDFLVLSLQYISICWFHLHSRHYLSLNHCNNLTGFLVSFFLPKLFILQQSGHFKVNVSSLAKNPKILAIAFKALYAIIPDCFFSFIPYCFLLCSTLASFPEPIKVFLKLELLDLLFPLTFFPKLLAWLS